jgi:hypothetical protein
MPGLLHEAAGFIGMAGVLSKVEQREGAAERKNGADTDTVPFENRRIRRERRPLEARLCHPRKFVLPRIR